MQHNDPKCACCAKCEDEGNLKREEEKNAQ